MSREWMFQMYANSTPRRGLKEESKEEKMHGPRIISQEVIKGREEQRKMIRSLNKGEK